MAQENPYAKYVTGGTQPAPPPPAVIPGVVSPTKAAADQRDQARTDIAIQGAERDARRETRDITKQGFDQEAKLRDDFNANLEVKAYKASLPSLQQALHAPKNGQGDLSVIYAYAKIMDPNSVVREGEMNMVTSSSPWLSTKIQNLRNQVDSSGRLPEETRRSLEQEMIRTTVARRKSYETQYQSYSDNAISYGLDPNRVVGPKEGQAFLDDMLAYDKENKLGRFAAGGQGNTPANGPRNPEMVGGVPQGTQIQFGMDAPQEPFDRAAYVQKTYGVTPEQEDLVIGFWNQNSGNEGLSVEGVKGWYQQNNLPLPSDEALNGMVEQAKGGSQFGPFDTSAGRQEYENQLNQFNRGREDSVGQAARDPNSVSGYSERAKVGLTSSFSDELAGVGGFIGNALTGKDPMSGYTVNRDAERLLQQQMREKQGLAGHVTEFAGSIPTALALPNGGGLGGAVKSGAAMGALYGAGTGEGATGTIQNALAGAVAGGVGGGALYGGGKALGAGAKRLMPNPVPNAGDVVAAGEREGVSVLTSDVIPPRTGFGRAAQRFSELTPLIGTGGRRAAQQQERIAAAQGLVDEYGGSAATIDDVTANLAKTRGDEISRLSNAKNKVIDGIEGAVETPRAIQAIDAQIAELGGANAEAFAPVISKLQSFREVLSSGKSLRQIETNRKLLGDMFKDPNLASIQGEGQKALNAIYGPLREDMGAFIKANAGNAAHGRWKAANDRLSAMAGELKDSAFKNVLSNAETTPEGAAKLLFSAKPSDLRRLMGGLSKKGQEKARAAVIFKVAQGATDNGVISPQKFASGMQAMRAQLDTLFPAAERQRIEGVVRLLKNTQRAVEANANPSTGAQAVPYLIGGAATQAPGMVAATTLLLRAYESATVRNMLLALAKSQPGSPAENALTRRIMDSVMTTSGTRTPANDMAADRIGGFMNQSAAAASPGQEEQNAGRKPIRQ